MPAERYYIDTPLKEGETITLEQAEHHHLVHVMRSALGDTVEVIDGKGSLAQASISSLGKREAQLKIDRIERVPSPSRLITLIQAIPRMNRLDTIIEKGTELGMTHLYLWASELSERKTLTPQQMQRAKQVAVAAMKQCGRLWLPEIHLAEPIKKWKPFESSTFFGDTDANAPRLLDIWKPVNSVTCIIGPESGLTKQEEKLLRKLGAVGIKLHENILRTDTAPLVALTLLTH